MGLFEMVRRIKFSYVDRRIENKDNKDSYSDHTRSAYILKRMGVYLFGMPFPRHLGAEKPQSIAEDGHTVVSCHKMQATQDRASFQGSRRPEQDHGTASGIPG